MKCLECGRHFVLLANHVIKKHHIAPDDYRRAHNIPLTQALADDELRQHLSKQAIIRGMTDEGINHLRMLMECRTVARGKRDLPEISTRHCHANNERKSLTFREFHLPLVSTDWLSGMSLRDISLKHGVANVTLRKWVREGYLPKRRLRYELAS